MKKLLFTIGLCALCASVSPLPVLAETPYDYADNPADISTPSIQETAPAADSQADAVRLRQAGREAFKKKDYATAVKYYRQAADLGDAEAQFCLGNRYLNGQGVTADKEQAFYWYEKAARQGNTDAQTNLGLCYLDGQGVEQNVDKGIYWLSLAADNGNLNAKFSFGICYIEGHGVSANPRQGITWIKSAAEQGLPLAQLYLGKFYCEGIGLDQDIEAGKKWFAQAAGSTDENAEPVVACAKEILNEINTTEATLAEAEELTQLLQEYLEAHESDDKETVSAIRNWMTSKDALEYGMIDEIVTRPSSKAPKK